MRRPVILILFGLGMASVLPSCTQQQLSRESVIEVLDSIEHKLQWVDYRISEEQWAYNTNGFSDSLQFFGHLYDRLVLTDPAYDLLRRGSSLLNDEVDARRAQLVLSRLQLARIEAHPELIALRESSNEQRLQAKPFRRNPLDHLFASEDYGALKDPARRQSSFIVGLSSDPQREKTMGRLVRLRNQLARREGYNNFFALSAAGLRIEVPAYLQLLDQLEQASRETYSDMLEGLDSGPDGRPVEIWDIGLLLQHEAERELERYFPQDSQFTFVHRTFDSLGFSLKQLPLYVHTQSTGGGQVQCLPIKSPHDVRIWGQVSGGVGSSGALLGQIGQALHALSISQDRALFVNESHPHWRDGISRLFASLISESPWLERYANVPPSVAERFRSSEQKARIVWLRILLAHLKFEHEMYTDSDRDLNQLYWSTIEQFLMIPRHEELVIWPLVEVFTHHPVKLQAALYGDLIAAQTSAYIEKQYGSLTGSNEAYSFLVQNYMRFGSRYPWEELLERGTGEPLNPQHFIARLGL